MIDENIGQALGGSPALITTVHVMYIYIYHPQLLQCQKPFITRANIKVSGHSIICKILL